MSERNGENEGKKKALELAVTQIEKQFGKGSIMKLGTGEALDGIQAISTGSLSLDLALGVGGLPRGRVVEIFGPESSGKTTLCLHAIASQLPLSLRGTGSFAMNDVAGFGVAAGTEVRDALEQLYTRGSPDPVVVAGRRALGAVADLEKRVGARSRRGGARSRRAGERLVESVDQLLVVDAAGLPVQAACLESGGWDTHVNQGGETGQMARWIGDLAEAVARLDAGLRGRREYRLVVMTEFGRTVRPNGSGGTDHGHGSVMLVAGAGVRGGLHGDWRGLGASALHEGRDLPVTTDWRSVLSEVVTAHLGRLPPSDTFPGYTPQSIGLFG